MEDSNEMPSQSPGPSGETTSPRSAKRPRYTPIACDECKRRKIKCDGQTPCHRCARKPTNCIYTQRGNNVISRQDMYVGHPSRTSGLTTSSEWKKMNEKLSKLQEQIDVLVSSAAAGAPMGQQQREQTPVTPVSASHPEQSGVSRSLERRDKQDDIRGRRRVRAKRHPQYMGPTSSTFGLGVARTSLREMGIQPVINLSDDGITSYATTPARSPAPSSDLLRPQNPLQSITRSEAIRLVELYEEESGTVYPFIDIRQVLSTARSFYNSTVPVHEAPATRASGQENMLPGGVLDILKLVVAIASVFEGHGPTKLSRTLLDSIESGFDGRLCGPSVDILELQAWTLMSILQFHCGEEALAWRTIGLAARAAVELGLHRRETYFLKFPDARQRLWANKLFWCIYVLDKRWSFGTGLPFALHDDDLDPDLPEQSDANSSLLKTMIAYGRIGSRVWKATSNLAASVNTEKQAFLDFQIRQWRDSIAPEFQLHPNDTNMLDGYSRSKIRLRVLLYLRANQMRLLVFRRALLSSKDIINDSKGAQQAVNIAKDTICVLDRLNRTSDIYSSQQTSFNYFLVSALATILLAVCHATSQFNQSCRKEFYLGLELVRGFSTYSHVARRLWRTVRYLKVIGPKLGILPTEDQPRIFRNSTCEGLVPQPSSTLDNLAPVIDRVFGADYAYNDMSDAVVSPAHSFPLDGNQLSNDLTSLFESIEPVFDQLPLSNSDMPEDFSLYGCGTTDNLTRSLMNLV